jgi:acyl-CoA carboxylase subunit alpha
MTPTPPRPVRRPIDRVLIANRGEIARRVIRTCHSLGITTVAVHSDADADAPYVREADEAVHLPGTASADTYLRADLLVRAAHQSGATAIHPGYGFLSENAAFAKAVTDAGLVWIGPPAEAIAAMGSKIGAKAMMRAAGVPVLPDSSAESLEEIGVPALVKASAGGGGRGMRIVRSADELTDAVANAEREAAAAFGDGTVFVERYVEGGRHVEIQVFADQHGNVVSLFERDCSLQRRHQKIVEESPSPAVDNPTRARMSEAAIAAARAVGYVGAGTVEFLLDRAGHFYFLEMNTRLQVEHPVTEMITGLDLVELQLLVAEGEPLPPNALHPVSTGHAIEVRLCAEDPFQGYRPSSGIFHRVEFPAIDGVRIDTGVESGSVVSPYYDSMIAKIVGHGPSRRVAARRVATTLERAVLHGPTTNREQLLDLVRRMIDLDDEIDTGWLDRNPPTEPPAPTAEQIAAAALAVVEARLATRPVLAGLPPGWRNNPSDRHEQRIGEHVVSYRFDRSGRLAEIDVDGTDLELETSAAVIARTAVELIGDRVHVAGGRWTFEVPPRYVAPDDAGRAGSLVAPMPGSVLRILVALGDHVDAGRPLLAMEAMKMEHQVVAPTAGTVVAIHVRPGQQLDTGQPLVQLGTEDET